MKIYSTPQNGHGTSAQNQSVEHTLAETLIKGRKDTILHNVILNASRSSRNSGCSFPWTRCPFLKLLLLEKKLGLFSFLRLTFMPQADFPYLPLLGVLAQILTYLEECLPNTPWVPQGQDLFLFLFLFYFIIFIFCFLEMHPQHIY